MIKIDGKAIAKKIINDLKKLPVPKKILVAVFVGQDESSAAFLRRKEKIADELGIKFHLHQLPESILQEELEKQIEALSNDVNVGGIIIQLPLPKKFDREKALEKIDPKKDVDALHDGAPVESPIVGVVKAILEDLRLEIKNFKMVVIIGKGILVGRPVIKWLESERLKIKDLRFKIADSKTENLKEFLSDADLIITGVGNSPVGEGLIKPEWLKDGAGVIDFGFPPDLNQQSLVNRQMSIVKCPELGFYTPTPGGTGPILVAKLFQNFYKLLAS